ncbi:RhuM family protein [Paraflavitalea speifideaquila]|uniref:RhuM family protein n=1 Tax=Paraflavitalea speifideaquila TaxID=3076558 RepID=UPI0028E67CE4|nr:RhuM family protein [Paraflavitalea speifideiaquila]
MEQNNQSFSDLVFYQLAGRQAKIAVLYARDTFWLNQQRLAELFGVDSSAITQHLQHLFTSSELDERSTSATFARVGANGKMYQVYFYNLDAIIAVGYRINSKKATQFHIWATTLLRALAIKSVVWGDESANQSIRLGKGYFDDLLVRIRAIRASEKQCYQKITAIYEECSIDYAQDAAITQDFFRTVQNKLHWAVTGKTAAQLIGERANAMVPHMGLQTWKNAPGDGL